jgi:hypothetical protein
LGSWCEQIEKKEVLSFGSSMSLGVDDEEFLLMCFQYIHESSLDTLITFNIGHHCPTILFLYSHEFHMFTRCFFFFFSNFVTLLKWWSSISILSKKWQSSKYESRHVPNFVPMCFSTCSPISPHFFHSPNLNSTHKLIYVIQREALLEF